VKWVSVKLVSATGFSKIGFGEMGLNRNSVPPANLLSVPFFTTITNDQNQAHRLRMTAH